MAFRPASPAAPGDAAGPGAGRLVSLMLTDNWMIASRAGYTRVIRDVQFKLIVFT